MEVEEEEEVTKQLNEEKNHTRNKTKLIKCVSETETLEKEGGKNNFTVLTDSLRR